MEVEAFLADSVVVADGKLFVQGGGWNVINTQALPTRHPRIGIGILVRVPYTATNQAHKFELRIEDADGELHPLGEAPPGVETEDGKIRRIEGEFNMGRPPGLVPGEEQLVPMAINMDGVEFPDAESYRVVIEIDGSEVKSLPFRINPVTQMRMVG